MVFTINQVLDKETAVTPFGPQELYEFCSINSHLKLRKLEPWGHLPGVHGHTTGEAGPAQCSLHSIHHYKTCWAQGGKGTWRNMPNVETMSLEMVPKKG